MDHIGKRLAEIERNIKLNSADPVAVHGFTQVPNFILKNPDLSIGAKTTYALFLSYAWHNDMCFPGQDRLAKAIGMSIGSVNAFIKELEASGLIDITRRGQGKTNLYTINFKVTRKPSKS
jgi:Helix-turn-helix domain